MGQRAPALRCTLRTTKSQYFEARCIVDDLVPSAGFIWNSLQVKLCLIQQRHSSKMPFSEWHGRAKKAPLESEREGHV